jgi:hypothetical protein
VADCRSKAVRNDEREASALLMLSRPSGPNGTASSGPAALLLQLCTQQNANQINANLYSRRIHVRQARREILLQQRRDSLADR